MRITDSFTSVRSSIDSGARLIVYLTAAAAVVVSPEVRSNIVSEKYSQLCASCHGENLEGARAPSLLDDVLVHGGDDDSLRRSIERGYPDKGMPAWGGKLSKGEVRSLVIYILEKRAGPRPAAGEIRIPPGTQTSELYPFRVEPIIPRGLEYPWSMVFLPDGRMLVTEKDKCELRVVEHGEVTGRPISGTPHDGRMYAVALHPDFIHNGWVYLSYVSEVKPESYWTTLVRGHIRDGAWTEVQMLLRLEGDSLGARIAFDAESHVYLTTGSTSLTEDREITYEAQDLSRAEGKIHRIWDDGRVPDDNPFVRRPHALPSIWTYGHRVPQGLAFDPRTGALWSTEHGPRGGDELNLIRKGRNYGWPVITYGMEYTGKAISFETAHRGMEQPVTYWTPSIGVSNIEFYSGNAFPKWRHNFFISSLRQRTLYRFVLERGRVKHREVILSDIGRIRDVVTGPDGYIYLLINRVDKGASAQIVRLVPAP